MKALSDADLQAKHRIRQRLADGQTLDDILVDLCRLGIRRVLGMRHFDYS